MKPPTHEPDRLMTVPPARAPHGTPLGSGYLLEYPIGHGSCGQVWRGRRRRDNGSVAIKVLHAQYASDPDMMARSLRERAALRNLRHANVVPVDDLVVEGDTLALVMELVDGVDVRRAMRDGDVDRDEALTVLAQVAHALAYVHAAGVVHRDVKPENIMLTRHDGQLCARLTDFGLAWVPDGRQLTESSRALGTPAYVAPEVLAGRPYDAAVDVYALGVTAYELLSGRRPFTGAHPLALMRAHLEEQPSRPPAIRTDVWPVVEACLAKDPVNRPTAAHLAAQLDQLRAGTGSGAAGSPATSSAGRRRARNTGRHTSSRPAGQTSYSAGRHTSSHAASDTRSGAASDTWSGAAGDTWSGAGRHGWYGVRRHARARGLRQPLLRGLPNARLRRLRHPGLRGLRYPRVRWAALVGAVAAVAFLAGLMIPAPGGPASAARPPVSTGAAVYEAEAGDNLLGGQAEVRSCPTCSGRRQVGRLGGSGTLTFTRVQAASTGTATVLIAFCSSTAQVRTALLRVNGGPPVALTFPDTGGWTTVATMQVTVPLRAGRNTLQFSSPGHNGPNLDAITVVPAGTSGSTGGPLLTSGS